MLLHCPHCHGPLDPINLPDNGGWDAPFHLVCFNDDCPYFVRGWQWMKERFGVTASYRHRLDPASGQVSPLAVWSEKALRERIVDAVVELDPPAARLEEPREWRTSASPERKADR